MDTLKTSECTSDDLIEVLAEDEEVTEPLYDLRTEIFAMVLYDTPPCTIKWDHAGRSVRALFRNQARSILDRVEAFEKRYHVR